MATHQTLVIAAHGSHHDAASAEPAYAHADRLRERRCFDRVRVAFWKEQPSLADVRSVLGGTATYVVPFTSSEGYFTDRVFPGELGLDGRAGPGTDLRYTEPVGTHDRIGDVVVDRVVTATDEAVDPEETGLAVVGHGTDRHGRSGAATAAHAERLRESRAFAAVEAAYLDQSPSVADVLDRFDGPKVVVVPLFMSHGHHVTRDVPEALGIPAGAEPSGGPWPVADKRVWYGQAIGTSPVMTSIILERASAAGADIAPAPVDAAPALSNAEAAFVRWLEEADGSGPRTGGTRAWGELAITVAADSGGGRRFALRHVADRARPRDRLESLASPAAVRARTRRDETGTYRPLRTARTLPGGWRFEADDPATLVRGVRAVYPASIDHWYAARTDGSDASPFESVVSRQQGRYRDLDSVAPATFEAAVDACCGGCVREPVWRDREPPAPAAEEPPCPEPCSFLLEAVRTFAGTDPEERGPGVDPTVPAAAFDQPGNRVRVRFQRSRRARDRASEAPARSP